MCVCVSERGREREDERASVFMPQSHGLQQGWEDDTLTYEIKSDCRADTGGGWRRRRRRENSKKENETVAKLFFLLSLDPSIQELFGDVGRRFFGFLEVVEGVPFFGK